MRLITHFELATKNTEELHGILRECYIVLAMSDKDSPERRNVLASIENIQRELGMS